MKSLVYKYILLFTFLIISVDIVVGVFFDRFFLKITYGAYGSINEGIVNESDIFILGSSRAKHHYVAENIENSLGRSCYNSGLGGYGLYLNYAILCERIAFKKPEIVILDISPNLMADPETSNKLNVLLPYYSHFNSFKEIIQQDPEFSRLRLFFQLYRYNSTLYDVIRSFEEQDKTSKGFSPLDGVINQDIFKPYYYQGEIIDGNKFNFLHKILDTCVVNNVKVIGVVSPTYQKYDTNNVIIGQVMKIFEEKNIEFYDFSKFDRLYSNPQYFKDQMHMNRKGAEIFTNWLIPHIEN